MEHRIVRQVLIALNGFLALTAAGGGIALVANLYTPPLDALEGSIFSSFLLPGLALLVLVGGSALAAVLLQIRRSSLAAMTCLIAGFFIVIFELVEIATIGSELGPAQTLQYFYLSLGSIIICLAGIQLIQERLGTKKLLH